MKQLWQVLLLLMLAISFAALSVNAQEDGSTPEMTPASATQYDMFDLSTPQSAVETFVGLFERGDFAGLFLVLAPETQDQWLRFPARTFNYGFWVQADQADALVHDVYARQGDGQAEQSFNIVPYVFHAVMTSAAEHNALLIDLRGEVDILSEEPATTVTGRSGRDVIAQVAGMDGNVRFRMVQSPSGRWRVFQVIAPGGDETWYPWAVKTDNAHPSG